jgi:peptidoglycan/LPS O-acetylase OafA/YrhL
MSAGARVAATRYYRPELDLLRFIAFFSVFSAHAASSIYRFDLRGAAQRIVGVLVSGQFGMQIFFLLSAFLIGDLLLTEKDRTGSVSVRDFYIRRAFRIWPLYYLGLAIGVVYAVIWAPGERRMLALFAVMLGNWFFALGGGWPPNPVAPLWSVSIEEQFYAICPWLTRFATRGVLLACAGVLMAVSVAVQFALGAAHGRYDTVLWTNTFVEFEYFAAGLILAVLLHGRDWRAPRAARLALAGLAAVSLIATPLLFQVGGEGLARSGWEAVAGFGLVLFGVTALFLSLLGVQRPPRAAVHLGKISYGLYVYHMPALVVVGAVLGMLSRGAHPLIVGSLRALVGLILTIVIAELSYRFFEKGFLRLKERFAAVQSRPV